MKTTRLLLATAALIAAPITLVSCTLGVSQAPGEEQPRVNISGNLTIQDFKTIKRAFSGGVAVPVPTTPWAFFQM